MMKGLRKRKKMARNLLLDGTASHDKYSGWSDGNQTPEHLRVWWFNGSGGEAEVDRELTVLA